MYLHNLQDAKIDLSNLSIQMGKPVSVIRNSKFCVDVLIGYSNRARSLFNIPTEDSIKRRELVFNLIIDLFYCQTHKYKL